jgi:hypothetical protein
MGSPSEWRDAAAKFEKLRERSEDRLDAQWSSTGWDEHGQVKWLLVGLRNPGIHTDFGLAAERAAVLLGQQPGPGTFEFWLERLKRESPNYKHKGISRYATNGGPDIEGEMGVVVQVCGASADQCYRLESAAIARETPKWRVIGPSEETRAMQALASELRFQRFATGRLEPAIEHSPPHAHNRSVADQLQTLRNEARLTVEQLAERVRIQPRSVWRHLSGTASPRIGNLGAYERAFTNLLKRKVVIGNTSEKRQ